MRIVDDIPTAVDDDDVVQSAENASIVVDVLENDTRGAGRCFARDGCGCYRNADGRRLAFRQSCNRRDYLYAAAEEVGTVTFDYTITDGDNDVSQATVTITLIADSTPVVRVTDVTVSEAGLADGSANDDSDIGIGSFTIATGGDTLAKLEVQDKDGEWINVTAGGTVAGADYAARDSAGWRLQLQLTHSPTILKTTLTL